MDLVKEFPDLFEYYTTVFGEVVPRYCWIKTNIKFPKGTPLYAQLLTNRYREKEIVLSIIYGMVIDQYTEDEKEFRMAARVVMKLANKTDEEVIRYIFDEEGVILYHDGKAYSLAIGSIREVEA